MSVLRLITSVVILLLAGTNSGLAQAPPQSQAAQKTLEAKVRVLIQRLDDDQRAERIRAEQQLRALGPDILSVLPDPRVLTSESARVILRQLRIELERQRARASVKASRVSLSGEYTLAQILDAVSRQTGNLIDSSGLKPVQLQQQIRLPVAHAPQTFWPVIDELSGRMGWKSVASARGRQAVRLVESPGGPGRVVYSGPVRLARVGSSVGPGFGQVAGTLL